MTTSSDRHQLRAHALRRQQLTTALIHGTARTWRHRHRTLPAILTGLITSAAIIIGTTAAATYRQHNTTVAASQAPSAEPDAPVSGSSSEPSPTRSEQPPTPSTTTTQPRPSKSSEPKPSFAPPTGPVDWYRLRGKNDSYCIDLYDHAKADGSPIYFIGCNDRANQLWSWWHEPGDPEGAWRIFGGEHRKCLDSTGNTNESVIIHKTCDKNATSQLWYFDFGPDNHAALRQHSSNLCIDTAYTHNQPLILWPGCSGGYDWARWAPERRIESG